MEERGATVGAPEESRRPQEREKHPAPGHRGKVFNGKQLRSRSFYRSSSHRPFLLSFYRTVHPHVEECRGSHRCADTNAGAASGFWSVTRGTELLPGLSVIGAGSWGRVGAEGGHPRCQAFPAERGERRRSRRPQRHIWCVDLGVKSRRIRNGNCPSLWVKRDLSQQLEHVWALAKII